MSKYRVGELVIVREDLIIGERYGNEVIVTLMGHLLGQKVHITHELGSELYLIKECGFRWSGEMFKKALTLYDTVFDIGL
jgi:hypothetical protein